MSLSPFNPFPCSRRGGALSPIVFEHVKYAVKILIWQMANYFLDSAVVSSVCLKINTAQYVLGPVDDDVMQLFMAPEPWSPGGPQERVQVKH